MKKRKITVNIDSTIKYLQLWNGIFNITNTGLQILAAFIDAQQITDESNLCSVRNKKAVANLRGIKDHNTLNNYIKRFKDKGAVVKKDGEYRLNPFLDPTTNNVEVQINTI